MTAVNPWIVCSWIIFRLNSLTYLGFTIPLPSVTKIGDTTHYNVTKPVILGHRLVPPLLSPISPKRRRFIRNRDLSLGYLNNYTNSTWAEVWRNTIA